MRKLSLILIILIASSIAYSQPPAGTTVRGAPMGADPALQQIGEQLQEGGHMRRAQDQQYNIRKRTHTQPMQTTATAQPEQANTATQPESVAAPAENCFTNPKMAGCMTREEIESLTSSSTATKGAEK